MPHSQRTRLPSVDGFMRDLSLIVVAAMLAATPVAAQETGRTVTVGAGAQLTPEFPGADSYTFVPLPVVDIRRRGDPVRFGAADQSLGFRLFGNPRGFSFGPVLGFQRERTEDDVGAPVGDIDFTFEPGAFVQFWAGPSVRLRAEARRGLGGHEGWVGDLGADLVLRDHATIFGIGPRLRWSDSDYQQAYFGVSPAAAAASALPAFSPDGGIYGIGAIAGVDHRFDRRWGIYGYAGYDRLVGDAADSPIVEVLGSRNQFSAGIALTYSFDAFGF